MKLLIWIALALVVVLWWLHLKKSSRKHAATSSQASWRSANGGEHMLQCAYCAVHLPSSEAIVATTGTAYCCEEHRLRHAVR